MYIQIKNENKLDFQKKKEGFPKISYLDVSSGDLEHAQGKEEQKINDACSRKECHACVRLGILGPTTISISRIPSHACRSSLKRALHRHRPFSYLLCLGLCRGSLPRDEVHGGIGRLFLYLGLMGRCHSLPHHSLASPSPNHVLPGCKLLSRRRTRDHVNVEEGKPILIRILIFLKRICLLRIRIYTWRLKNSDPDEWFAMKKGRLTVYSRIILWVQPPVKELPTFQVSTLTLDQPGTRPRKAGERSAWLGVETGMNVGIGSLMLAPVTRLSSSGSYSHSSGWRNQEMVKAGVRPGCT